MKSFMVLLLVSFLAVPSSSLWAASGSSYGGNYRNSEGLKSSSTSVTEQRAIAAYNKGLKQRDKAWGYAERAKTKEDKAKQKLEKKSQKAYAKAITEFKKAVKHNPEMYQAYSSLGFALRKTGALQESLLAYEKSLAINPDYYEAIEYLAETRMQLHEFAHVRLAYSRLANEHPEYARQLITAIGEWLPQQRAQEISGLSEFSDWYKTVNNS